jgi:hypothetical protein
MLKKLMGFNQKTQARSVGKKPLIGEKCHFSGRLFLWITPGCFQMGSPLYEPDREVEETPHKVCIDQGY